MVARAFLLREGDRVRVVTPFVREFVDTLKAHIPYHARGWDGETKHWLIDGDYEDALTEVASEYFDVTMVVSETEARRRERTARAEAASASRPGSEPSASPHNVDECARRVRHVYQDEAALYLLPGVPWKVVQSAYRALAMILHPDVAGPASTKEMVRVNQAYEALERRHKGASR